MGKLLGKRWNLIILWLGVVSQLLFLLTHAQNLRGFRRLEENIQVSSGVQLLRQNRQVVMSNGLVSVTVRVPHGVVSSVTYKGSDNLLQTHHKSVASRGYWDVVWNQPGDRYNYSLNKYVMLRDSPGFYSYVILERLKGWPAYEIGEGRLAFKLNPAKQRIMPMQWQGISKMVALLITHPTNPLLKGEVDDKYLYSCENKDNKVDGWVSSSRQQRSSHRILDDNSENGWALQTRSHLTYWPNPTFYDLSIKFKSDDYWKKVSEAPRNVGNVVFEAPRNGPTLWEIGIPDCTAAEFFIPDPSPKFKIHPYPKPVEKFRQWERYKDYYPETDLIYTIGQSNYTKDWFYAHVTRNTHGPYYDPTTWKIRFELEQVERGPNYTLQLALASVSQAELQVRVNDPNSSVIFTTGLMGNDNAVGRHGIHGLYRWYSIAVQESMLVEGKNTIFFTQKK